MDGSVRRIEYAYDEQGNQYLITSYDAASGGDIVNQVLRQFNGLGQITAEYQSDSGAVDTSTTPVVQYSYTEMADGVNNSRLTSITYPDGYVLNYNYGDSGSLNDTISRLDSLSDSTGTLESYKYLGLDTVVERDHPQTGVNLTYISQTGSTGDAGDQYTGLDRFGRVVDQNCYDTTTSASVDDYQYGYDPDGDVLYKENMIDAALSQLFGYNNLQELTSFEQGTLNHDKTGLTGSASASQSWSPDALGNFTSSTTNGTTQTEAVNQQNQITAISDVGTTSYDGNGNMTADGSGNTYIYDAWNRLVVVNSGDSSVATYSYDGTGRRITETHGSTTTALYFSTAGQVLEEQVGGVTQARNVWSPVYVNALVLRDQSSAGDGTLDQRLYVAQDANWNVTALIDASGNVVEQYVYDPYGGVTVLTASWGSRTSSSYNWLYLFQGGRYDGATGLYVFAARVESPTLGRWMQNDPISFAAGDDNTYRLAGNAPSDRTDPTGLLIWGAGAGGLSGAGAGGASAAGVGAGGGAAGTGVAGGGAAGAGAAGGGAAGTGVVVAGVTTAAAVIGTAVVGVGIGYGISKGTGFGDWLGDAIGDVLYPPITGTPIPWVPKTGPGRVPKSPPVQPDNPPKNPPKKDCQALWAADNARIAKIAKEMKDLGASPQQIAVWVTAASARAAARKAQCEAGGDVTLEPYEAPW